MTGRPDQPGDRRLWVRVMNDLHGRIAAGEYVDGPLPGRAVLAPEMDVSPPTVQRAFHELNARGIVYRVPGRGYYVRDAGVVDAARRQQADALRWAWSGVYEIMMITGGLEARRLDGTGSVAAATAEELRDAIREDYLKYAAGPAGVP